MITAKIVADSKNEFGNRITTMVVTFPRIILAEFNTHRMFSRNSASSRAIPFKKMVESIKENPFIPMAWQKDHKGMQGTEYLDERGVETSTSAWLVARNKAVEQAEYLNEKGVTKQLVNRLLEPYMWHTVIVTATEWENFFALRCPQYQHLSVQGDGGKETSHRSKKDWLKHCANNCVDSIKTKEALESSTNSWLLANKGQAEIHMMALAEAMWDAYNESTPKLLKAGEWHIPFGDQIDDKEISTIISNDLEDKNLGPKWETEDYARKETIKIQIATARAARISYTVVTPESVEKETYDKVPEGIDPILLHNQLSYERDIKLHDKLVADGHMSPFEHCAQAMSDGDMWYFSKQQGQGTADLEANKGWSGNFQGFIQYRKTIANENKT